MESSFWQEPDPCALSEKKQQTLRNVCAQDPPNSGRELHLQHAVRLQVPHEVTERHSGHQELLVVRQRHGEHGLLIAAQAPIVAPRVGVALVTRHRRIDTAGAKPHVTAAYVAEDQQASVKFHDELNKDVLVGVRNFQAEQTSTHHPSSKSGILGSSSCSSL